jgi:hypothetical protein
MSLNQIVSYNPAIDDTDRLNLKVGDVDCLNLTCENINVTGGTFLYDRIYTTPRTVSASFTTTEFSLYNSTDEVGSNIIPANTIKQGTTIIFSGWGTFSTTSTSLPTKFLFKYNNTAKSQDVQFPLSQAYPTNSTYEYRCEIFHDTANTLKSITKIKYIDANTGTEEKKTFNDYTGTINYDPTIDNTLTATFQTFITSGNISTVSNSITKIN